MVSVSVSIRNISKMYRLYNKPQAKLKEALLRGIFRSKRAFHKEFWALRDINLDICEGECFGIIGQNGSGKSTLLQIVAGVLQPTSGSVSVNGRIAALLELGAGFNREFTGRENVFMNGAILGIPREEMEKRFDDIAAFADIGGFINQPVKTYSSGMFVRLAFATAIHMDPEILIVDEALAVGDMMFRNRCYQSIEKIRKAGKTIIFVSHDMAALHTFCDRACLIDRGKILEIGKPDTLINTYNKLMADRQEEYWNRIRGNPVSSHDERFTTHEAKREESEFRYGMGAAEIIEYQVLDSNCHQATVIETGKPFYIVSTSHFKRECEKPVIGVMIKTIHGTEVFGVNTMDMNIPVGPISKGESIRAEFCIQNNLNIGEYKFNIGVSEKTEVGVIPLDRRVDVGVFKVVGPKKTYGLVNLDTNVKITRVYPEG